MQIEKSNDTDKETNQKSSIHHIHPMTELIFMLMPEQLLEFIKENEMSDINQNLNNLKIDSDHLILFYLQAFLHYDHYIVKTIGDVKVHFIL